MVADALLLPFSASPVVIATMYAGTVGWSGVPSPAIATGSPWTLLATSTATAPAVCALRIFVEKVHVPREISAILPVRLPAGRAAQARLSELPESTTPSGAVRSAETVAKSPEAAPNVAPPTTTGAPIKCGAVLAPAVSARAAEPGDST